MPVIVLPSAKASEPEPVVKRAIAEVGRLCKIGGEVAGRKGLGHGETELQVETRWPSMPKYRLRVRDRWLEVPDGIGNLGDEEIARSFEALIREAIA